MMEGVADVEAVDGSWKMGDEQLIQPVGCEADHAKYF